VSENTFKMVTLIGESPSGIEDAVQTALSTSAENVRGQTWCQVSDIRANINSSGGVDRWQVQVEVAFRVDAG
jgi:dodecin